jgi:peptide/nickel transport system ATP-binding protein
VRLGSVRLDRLPAAERRGLRGRRQALLPQEPWTALDPTMPVAAQVAQAARLVAGRAGSVARAGARASLEAVGLGEAEARYPHELSGGMAQRAAFAAATVTGAAILIADEPTKGLDAAVRDRIAAFPARVPDGGGTLPTITHDAAPARAPGGRVAILGAGRIVEEGAAAAVLGAPTSDHGRALVAAESARWARAARLEPGPLRVARRALALDRGGRTIRRGVDLALHAAERVAVTGLGGPDLAARRDGGAPAALVGGGGARGGPAPVGRAEALPGSALRLPARAPYGGRCATSSGATAHRPTGWPSCRIGRASRPGCRTGARRRFRAASSGASRSPA